MTMLLDSVILIDHFNGIEQATDYIRTREEEACISVVTRAEVLVGFGEYKARRQAKLLLDALPLLNLVQADADAAAALRRSHGWKLPDAFQAALAQRHGLTLATRNTRDFDPDTHAFVAVPYTL